MNIVRSADPHGDPQHPLPCLDRASWRRFLEPVDLYVLSADEHCDPKEHVLRSLQALETLAGTLTDDPDDVYGGIVVGTGERFSLIHEARTGGDSTTIEVNAILGDAHHNLSMEIPTDHGPWPIMVSEDGTTSVQDMRTALRRLHRVLCCHLRMMLLQRDAAGMQDDMRRRAIVDVHVMPLFVEFEHGPTGIDLPTPWGGPVPVRMDDSAERAVLVERISQIPVLAGTRLAVSVSHMPPDDKRGPITTIAMKPVRERVARGSVDVIECMRQADRLRRMGPLKR